MATKITRSSVEFSANDGQMIHYEKWQTTANAIGEKQQQQQDSPKKQMLFVHGWSGSNRYWKPALDLLLQDDGKRLADLNVNKVIAIDLRGHGKSACNQPCHLARLVMDVRELIEIENLTEIVAIGSSMGAAILWSYCELYGNDRIVKAVFVDQAPLQYQTDDWKLGSLGLKGPSDLANLKSALVSFIRSSFLCLVRSFVPFVR